MGSIKQTDNIIFDLDGTLTDNGRGIKKSFIYALNRFSITANPEELDCIIGPPLMDSFMKNYNFSYDDAETAVKYYREYYRENGIFDNELYCGVRELLSELSGFNKKLYIATSKPEEFANRIVEHFGIDKYFTFIGGASLDFVRAEKSEVIDYVLEKQHISDKTTAIMVGDRFYDIQGAHKCGLKAIGILYGYGERLELENVHADYISETVDDLRNLLI